MVAINPIFMLTACALMACSILLLPIHEEEYAIASKSEVDSNSTSPSFAAAGDWGCTAETEKIVANIISVRSDLVLALGDLSYEKTADCWLDIVSPIKNKTRIAIGNHDVISPSLVRQYLNEFGLGKQYYSFDYQSIHFVSLSTEVSFDKNSEQFHFLIRDLTSAASNPEIKWIIVFFHEPMYISPSIKSVAVDNEFREIYHPLFSKFQVDLVLAGHNHNYERSYPIKYNSEEPSEPIITSVNKTIYDNPDGQIFIVAGTAGRNLYKFFGQAPYISTQYIGHGLAYFHLSDAKTVLSARFYSDDGVVEDEFSIKKTPNVEFIANNFGPYNILSYNDPIHFSTLDDSRIQINRNNVTLNGSEKATTFLSNTVHENLSYIEGKFRVIAENAIDNHAGLVWNVGNISYYAFMRPHSVSIYNSIDKEFAKAINTERDEGQWHTLKIVFENNIVSIYVDDERKLQFPNHNSSAQISNIGIESTYNIAQFSPVKVGLLLNQDTIYVDKQGNNTIVYSDGRVVSYGRDSTVGIQKAINHASESKKNEVLILPGRYQIRDRLNFTENLFLHGNGKDTILDYSGIGEKNTLAMAPRSKLKDLNVEGSNDKFPEDLKQKTVASHGVKIENVVFRHLGYGIELAGAKGATLLNITCDGLQSKNSWAACIHGGFGTTNITINKFKVTNSNRGVELEDGASNIKVKNGYLYSIGSFQGAKSAAFSLDAHTHEARNRVSNVLFENIYLNNTYAPTTKIAVTSDFKFNSTRDLPFNITYQNITLLNPTSRWQINGDDVLIKDSRIIGSKTDIFVVYDNSRNILVLNVTADPIHGDSYYIFNPSEASGIKNVTIMKGTLKNSPDKTGPVISFHGVDRLSIRDNMIERAPNNIEAIDLSEVQNLLLCGNIIDQLNGNEQIFARTC